MSYATNDNVAEMIGEELELANRIEAAKNQAITFAFQSALTHAQSIAHGFEATNAGPLMLHAKSLVEHAFSNLDYAYVLEQAGAHAAYKKGFDSVRMNAADLLDRASPEFKTRMAESSLHEIGKHVAGLLCESLTNAKQEAQRRAA